MRADCPVLPLAREARRLVDEFNLSGEALCEPDATIPPRLFALEAQAAPLRALSLEGQLYQALIVHGAGEALAAIAEEAPDAPLFTRLFRSASVSLIASLARVDYQRLMAYYCSTPF